MSIYKIECTDNNAVKFLSKFLDEFIVIEGTAILTTHSFTELEAELIGQFVGTTCEPNGFDLATWVRESEK